MITKTAMITICGRPNVGKSTLTNALVGEKIAIVSNKPQTTRNRISAVVNRGDTQLILMDTPGFHKPRNRLGDYMVQVVRESVADVDGVMLVVEPIASIGEQEHALIERIRTSNAPAVLVINKMTRWKSRSCWPSSPPIPRRCRGARSCRCRPRTVTVLPSSSTSLRSLPCRGRSCFRTT